MHNATNGQDSQGLLLVWSGQHGISSAIAIPSIDMDCASALAAESIGAAMTGAASGASNSPAATSSMIETLASLLRCMVLCRIWMSTRQRGLDHVSASLGETCWPSAQPRERFPRLRQRSRACDGD